ncbi:MAG: hypothetical protein AB1416_13470 [Actinomycetota bacterium]
MIVAGLHLEQHLGRVSGPPRSAVAAVTGDGRLRDLRPAGDDDDVLAAIPEDAALVVVDAPLAIPEGDRRRDAETVLAWCDHAAFPVSRARMEKVYGGARGVRLAPALGGAGRAVAEAVPDLVLRQLAWEREHPAGAPPLDLAEYRARWLAVRAPAFRPRGGGRARPAGIHEARALLAAVLDLAGWEPEEDGGDWAAIRDAARVDALACAYAGVRHLRGGGSVALGAPDRGLVLVPADANLAGRIALHVERLRAEAARTRAQGVGAESAGGDTPLRPPSIGGLGQHGEG